MPFVLYEYQKKAIRAILANDKTIINKARQLGFSTVMAAFVTWLILFHDDKDVLIVANKKEVAKNLLAKVKVCLASIPNWMYLADPVTRAVHTISFSNGSLVRAVAGSPDAARSFACSLLILDEAAHIEKMDQLWEGAGSVTATGGKVVALSTPKGVSGWFYEIFSKASSGEIDWYPITTHWWENPYFAEGIEDDPQTPGGKTSPWFRSMTEGWSDHQIAQELLTSFIESGLNFFGPEIIEYYRSISVDPIRREGFGKNLWIWKDPVPGFKYLISADVCSGSGADYATIHVLELRDMEVVAEYKEKIPPDLLGDLLVSLGERYNMAYIVPEGQGIGLTTCYHIKNLGYRNLCYFHKETGALIDQWAAEYRGVAPGQPMTLVQRPMILAKAEEFLRKRLIKIYSKRFVSEMETFVNKNNKPQAQGKKHDDLIMCLAIGIWVRDMCPDFRGSLASADAAAAIAAITRNNETYKASNSVEFRTAQHKDRIQKLMHEQKVPLNPGSVSHTWLYKI